MKPIPHSRLILLTAALLSGLLLCTAGSSAAPVYQGTPTPAAYLPLISRPNTGPTIGGCPVFPGDNIWNTRIDHLPADPNSSQYIAYMDGEGDGADYNMHPDFGSGVWPPNTNSPIGIPYVVVPAGQGEVTINYKAYGNESDDGPFPIPGNAPIEGGPNADGDRHVLVVRSGECKLYELFNAWPQSNGSWEADSGAVYNLNANGPLRPAGYTSADAAGLPILPGLVRYDEVAAGEIKHALRFTGVTFGPYRWPARHRADGTDENCSYCPKMGQRFRLKASFNVSAAPPRVRVILTAMQRYGLIMADNGSPWYLTGAPDARWDNDELGWLQDYVHGSDFEAVDASSLMINVNSGQARQP